MSSFISKQKIKVFNFFSLSLLTGFDKKVEEFLGAHKTKDAKFERKKEIVESTQNSMRNMKNLICGLGASISGIFKYLPLS